MKNTTGVIEELQERWNRLLGAMECNGATGKHFETIVKAYTSSDRFYHNLHHILSSLELVDRYEHLIDLSHCVKFAIFLHDIVHNVEDAPGENEQASVRVAEAMLKDLGYGKDELQTLTVGTLIMATTHPDKQFKTVDEGIMADIDLAILGSDKPTYSAYRENIRKEYRMFPDEIFYPKRKEILEIFLERLEGNRLFLTSAFQRRCSENARRNIEKEIQDIDAITR